ncbi:Uncharacterised protein [uncultured archaeon]|nr:Uncharacterised protein [uncultured archaeon]
MNIKIIGLDEKDKTEEVENLINKDCEKLERKIGEETSLEINIKKYGKVKTNEFEISARLFCFEKAKSSKQFFEANVTERDLVKGIRKIIEKLNTEIEHKMHLSDRRRK